MPEDQPEAGYPPATAGSNQADRPVDWFEDTPCGQLLTDASGRIERANHIFASWTGYDPQTLVGKPLPELLPIAGRIFYETHFVPMLRLQEQFNEVALDFVRADGTRMPALVNAMENRDTAGQPHQIRLAVFRTTDRRRYERSLLDARNIAQETVRAEREVSELREQFIAVLGHDLRNPIASIGSGMRLLRKEALSERGRHVVELVEGSVVRASGLIDNVLDFARGRLGGGLTLTRDALEPLEPVLRQVVGELRAIAPERTMLVEYALDEPVDCDRGRIGQLLSNLLGNALTHGAMDEPVRVLAKTAGGTLVISVANGGPPIPGAVMAHLFQPFVRGQGKSDRDGLGLGLHIASEIAKAHGGTLEVTSDEAVTCFTFAMPVPSAHAPRTIASAPLRPL